MKLPGADDNEGAGEDSAPHNSSNRGLVEWRGEGVVDLGRKKEKRKLGKSALSAPTSFSRMFSRMIPSLTPFLQHKGVFILLHGRDHHPCEARCGTQGSSIENWVGLQGERD